MEKTRELPLPQELKSRIRAYASDKIGTHQTAHLIHALDMFDDPSYFKLVMCRHEIEDYFIVLRDGHVCVDMFRTYDLHWPR